MKYAIGQKVRIRPDLQLWTTYSMNDGLWDDIATEEMLALRGQLVTIVRTGCKYYIREDGGAFNWTDGMLLPVTRIARTKELL